MKKRAKDAKKADKEKRKRPRTDVGEKVPDGPAQVPNAQEADSAGRPGARPQEPERSPSPVCEDDVSSEKEETEEDIQRRLDESRARREALMAKWVTRGEGGAIVIPDTNTSLPDEEQDGNSDGEVAAFFEKRKKELDEKRPTEQDEKAQEEKRKVSRFILEHRAEHDGDMFNENEEDQDALKKGADAADAINQTGASGDDWNDKEGYYKAQIGEVMDGRYRITDNECGKGVFSTVVKAEDQQDKMMVAIKIVRSNDMMQKASEKEAEILQKINGADKDSKRNVIRMLRTFTYRGHLCLVFECMWDNLRVALKKYTKDKGMSLKAVRAYCRQLLIAIQHIHRCEYLHTDIKPDNILISGGHNQVKICDLGSAVEFSEIEQTPYIVSRFYRAPEICIGAKYGPPADIFALGASFFELFTGKILFPGKSNNDMIRLFMEYRGKLPHKMIKSGTCWKQHFDENLDFKFLDYDKLTRKKKLRIVTDCSAKKNILDVIMARVGVEKQKSTDKDDENYVKKAKQFADFIGQMTGLNPETRSTPQDLLQHSFLHEWPGERKGQGKGQAAKPDAKGPASAMKKKASE